VKAPGVGSRGYRAKLELQARLPGEISRDDDEAQVLESRCGLLEVEKALDLGDEQGKVLPVGVIEQQKVCPRDGHRVRPSVPEDEEEGHHALREIPGSPVPCLIFTCSGAVASLLLGRCDPGRTEKICHCVPDEQVAVPHPTELVQVESDAKHAPRAH